MKIKSKERLLNLEARQAIEDLGRLLNSIDYSEAGVLKALATETDVQTPESRETHFSYTPADVPVHLRRLKEGNKLSVFIKLFLLGSIVHPEEVKSALQPLPTSQLETVGLLDITDEGVRATVKLLPYGGLVFACDPYPESLAEMPSDHVTGVNPTSITLAALTLRQPVNMTLDLGTGCGVQALLSARHSSHVVAVDINPRALNFTAFNALLNRIDNVECREGNLFEPVEGCQFDLIISNPPYVISPDRDYIFRDSELPGDTVCQNIINQVPDYLVENGTAHILCNWSHHRYEDWSQPLKCWVEGNGCNVWLLHYKAEDPLTYAANWNQYLRLQAAPSFSIALDRWLAYYHELGIEVISSGAIIMERTSKRPNWLRIDRMNSQRITPCSDHIKRVIQANDFLATLKDDKALLSSTLKTVESHNLKQTLRRQGERYIVQDMRLCLEDGLRFEGAVDALTFELLSRFEGIHDLASILAEMSQITGLEIGELTSATLTIVRSLMGSGFLVRV